MPYRRILLACASIVATLGGPDEALPQHFEAEGVVALTDAERAEDALTAASAGPLDGATSTEW